MRGHRQDSAQKWGLPCRWLFCFSWAKTGMKQTFVQTRSEVMVTSTTLKKLLSGGFTLGGLNLRIYRRTFPSAIKYSEISWVGFTNRPSKVGISEGTFQRSWFRVESDLRKPTDQRKSLEAEHWQLNSRYREGYDRHDTVKGTRESVNTSVITTDRSNIGSAALKKNKRW